MLSDPQGIHYAKRLVRRNKCSICRPHSPFYRRTKKRRDPSEGIEALDEIGKHNAGASQPRDESSPSSPLGVGAAQTGLDMDSAFYASFKQGDDRVLEDSTAEAIVLTNPPLSTPIKVGDLIYVIARPRWERRQGRANCKVTVDHDVDDRDSSPTRGQSSAAKDASPSAEDESEEEEERPRKGAFFNPGSRVAAPAVGLNRMAPVMNVNVQQDNTRVRGNHRSTESRRRRNDQSESVPM